ncbi:hypothetical protein DIS24_g325 [Lasiodiplodia hormozganensis]|uniref:Uncharacterized protein n=3 Tax=Lasiodiplodia TaxID=66739 RepID=A0A5N5DNL2_9PEZI|nr:hypothetical protein DBV05_g1951 [Lasiodiplodia theobromae]KAK0664767.1 hypothetical protein DIS24_g325 [Lasiodiplodia hormozganensis]
MTALNTDDLEDLLASRPSLAASVDDCYDLDAAHHRASRSPFFGIPSTHSGFRSEESETEETDSAGPWSPPAWRKAGSGWYRHHHHHHLSPDSPSRSRETSPPYESAGEGDAIMPANVPLPMSPLKQTPRTSPERDLPWDARVKKEEHQDNEDTPQRALAPRDREKSKDGSAPPQGISATAAAHANNYIRLALRAEVQHRTEPYEAAYSWLCDNFSMVAKSRTSTLFSVLVGLLSIFSLRLLLQPPSAGHVPDLVKVAGLAKAFEPFIYYSENGVSQIGDLQETGVAVWDLGESVRLTNMTSAPIIVKELDELSESLKTLSVELTKFFANVDGDVDSILIVMDWAKRELAHIQTVPESSLSSVFGNVHRLLSRIGLLETSSGAPTAVGKVVRELFGQTSPQRTKATLQRTFNEFLNVLEESINNELTASTALFSLYESIDRQFLNLQRTVLRETDQQEREEGDLLSSLWTRLMGANASRLRKYEKNRQLLASLRARTLLNKGALGDHRAKLQQLKSNLEMLRKRLISPLLRSNESSTLAIEDQIRGLDGTYEYLHGVRERQKTKVMGLLYGPSERILVIEGNSS